MRRIIFALCFLMILVSAILIPPHARASDKEEAGVDIAIVVDTSGSMKSTDPNHIAIEAAKLFIDMTEISDTRIALVTFSDQLGRVTTLKDIHTISDKESIKSNLNEISYQGDTDMGLALEKGYEILKEGRKDKKQQAILFFTDGNIDLNKSKTRTNEESLQETSNMVDKSSKDGIPIYTIGLNSDGSVDEKLLSDIAKKTNGRSYLVDKPEVLPEIFNEIFADFINSNIISLGEYTTDGKNYTEVPVEIPNNSVLEANIIVLSDKKMEAIELYNPSGKMVPLNSEKALRSESKQYTLLKLITPEKGNWKLRMKGANGCKVHINLIFNYKVKLANKAELVTNGADSYIKVTSWLEKDGEKIEDEALYSSFTGKVYCNSPGGETTFPMTKVGSSFTAQIPIENMTGDIKLHSRVENNSLYRESEVSTISIKNRAPVFKNFPTTLELKGLIGRAQKKKLILSDYVIDPEGDEITYQCELQPSEKNISVKIKDNILIITGGKRGQGEVKITAVDSKGAAATSNLAVNVKSMFSGIGSFLLFLLLMVLITGLLIFAFWKFKKLVKEKNQIFYGAIRWGIIGERSQEQLYQLGYEKGSVSLSKLISEPSLNELGLSKITMRMTDSVEGIEIKNKSKNCMMIMGFGGSPRNKLELMNGEFAILDGKYMGNDISVKLTYSLY